LIFEPSVYHRREGSFRTRRRETTLRGDKQVQGFKIWSGLRFLSCESSKSKQQRIPLWTVRLSYYLASFTSVLPLNIPAATSPLAVFLEDKRSGCTGKTMPRCCRFIATTVSRRVGIVSLEDYIGSPRARIIPICVFHSGNQNLRPYFGNSLLIHRIGNKLSPLRLRS